MWPYPTHSDLVGTTHQFSSHPLSEHGQQTAIFLVVQQLHTSRPAYRRLVDSVTSSTPHILMMEVQAEGRTLCHTRLNYVKTRGPCKVKLYQNCKYIHPTTYCI